MNLANTDELQAHFERVAQGTSEGSYEELRWKKNPRTRVQHEATEAFIRTIALPGAGTPSRILELGPGPGTWTRLLAGTFPDAAFTLTDISPEMLEKAATTVEQPIETIPGEFASVVLPSSSFDYFFSSRAFEYLLDKEGAVDKIADALRPGAPGCIITKMPKPLMNRLSGRVPSAIHRGQVSPRTLASLLTNSGCTVNGVYPVSISVPLLRSAAADWMANRLFTGRPIGLLGSLFAESYAVLFTRS